MTHGLVTLQLLADRLNTLCKGKEFYISIKQYTEEGKSHNGCGFNVLEPKFAIETIEREGEKRHNLFIINANPCFAKKIIASSIESGHRGSYVFDYITDNQYQKSAKIYSHTPLGLIETNIDLHIDLSKKTL